MLSAMALRFVRQPTAIEYRPWRPVSWLIVIVGAALPAILCGIAISNLWERGPLARYEYHIWRWEADTLIDNLFHRIGIGPEPDDSAGERALQQYFRLTSAIRAAQDTATPDVRLVDALTNERAAYENDVERLAERYIGEAVKTAGLQRSLPLFSSVRITWPPPDLELTSPPRLLVRSPRAKIQRQGDALLKEGLTLADIERIEATTDDADTVSLVVSIGGLAAYPAIVRDDRSYDSFVDTASHEWVHHYLAFYPLGQQWGKGGDAETLNETTANIAGREIGNLIRKAHPISLPETTDGRAAAGPAPTVDFSKEMRQLRLEVDGLLAAGNVAEAEKTMEDRRQYLADHGIPIRKLNQAYFAFYGTYGDSPASSSPVGPKIERVWDLTKDVGLFLKTMREVKNVRDLDAAIARLQGAR
jgi:hypothetical protein